MQHLAGRWKVPKSCSEMLKSMLNLSETEFNVYKLLLSAGSQRVADFAGTMDRDRSSIQRALQSLMSTGLIRRSSEKLRNGGYYYVYDAVPPSEVKRELERCIKQWHETLLDSLERFEEEIGG